MIKYFMIGDNGQSVTGLAGSFRYLLGCLRTLTA